MRILLVRHGQTSSNLTGELDTAAPGAELTALGHEQAAAIPAALATRRVDAVYASRLVRTQLTAQPLAADRDRPIQIRDGIEEISAGDLEMLPGEDARGQYIGCVAAWLAGDLTPTLPGGTDGHAFLRRYDDALRTIADENAPDAEVVVFSHGAAIRCYTVLRTQAFTPAEAAELYIENTGSSLLEADPTTGWRLISWTPGPLGGPQFSANAAHDFTGEGVVSSRE